MNAANDALAERYATLWRLAKEASEENPDYCLLSEGPCVHDDLISFLADPANQPVETP